jgi:hypothetical protein
MRIAGMVALMLNLAVASAMAQQNAGMTFSGTSGASAIDLKQPNANTVEEDVSGNGTLGPFTFRNISAIAVSPQPSSSCLGVFFPRVAGAGVLRFQDGSLLQLTLQVDLMHGGDCIDFVHMLGHCTLTFNITGGTGRFKNASGVLTYSETATPLLADGYHLPVFFSEVGEFTGTISRVATEAESKEVER